MKWRWLLTAAAVLAFWPRFFPLPDDLPGHRLAQRYRSEALQALALARRHPAQGIFDRLVVQQWHFGDWRTAPGSGDGYLAIPEASDVLVTATALGPWGVPVARYTICCGASGWRVGG